MKKSILIFACALLLSSVTYARDNHIRHNSFERPVPVVRYPIQMHHMPQGIIYTPPVVYHPYLNIRYGNYPYIVYPYGRSNFSFSISI